MFGPQIQEKIDLIRRTISISDVFPGVKDKGTSDCPFCKGRNKFYVKNGWGRCFRPSCDLNTKSLDVIGLYRYKNDLYGKGSFFKALDSIQEEYSLPVPVQKEEILESILEKVSSIYNFEINSRYGKEAMSYLISRGIDKTMIDILQIGFARNDSILRTYGLEVEDLRLAGLIQDQSESFSNRLIFPIRSLSGDIKHLTGRYLGPIPQVDGDDIYPRWKHSLSNSTGVTDYMGLEENLQSYKSDYIVLTEGYIDAISLYQLGIQSCCIFGLYGIHKHLSKLRRFKDVYCAFDVDTFSKDHPLFPNEFKSWRVVLPQLVDMQILCPSSTFHVFLLPSEVSNSKGSFICKDINEWVLASNPNKEVIMEQLVSSPSILQYLMSVQGPNLQYHESLLRLCISTNTDYSSLAAFIPNGMSSLDYAVALLTR